MSPSCKTIFLPLRLVQSMLSITIIMMTGQALLAAGAGLTALEVWTCRRVF
jgi:hypothetical protein